jgi:hypothetical protein
LTPAELKALAFELTEHMADKGVRHMKLGGSPGHNGQLGGAAFGGSWHLELELDPAAQLIRASAEEVTRADPKPKPDGECPVVGCEKRGGHMGQRWCAGHFQAALRGQVS